MSHETNPIGPDQLSDIVSTDPSWYLRRELSAFLHYFSPQGGVPSARPRDWDKSMKNAFFRFMTDLQTEKVLLGKRQEFFNDDDRLPIEIIVLHHTVSAPTISVTELNAFELLRLYVPNSSIIFPDGPPTSGHYYKGKETFIGYHYVVRPNGSYQQILRDEYVGFHAGDYKTNCRSIGIAFAGDLTDMGPTEDALKAAQKIISKYEGVTILGHGEVYSERTQQFVDTACPGRKFYRDDGWKKCITSELDAIF